MYDVRRGFTCREGFRYHGVVTEPADGSGACRCRCRCLCVRVRLCTAHCTFPGTFPFLPGSSEWHFQFFAIFGAPSIGYPISTPISDHFDIRDPRPLLEPSAPRPSGGRLLASCFSCVSLWPHLPHTITPRNKYKIYNSKCMRMGKCEIRMRNASSWVPRSQQPAAPQLGALDRRPTPRSPQPAGSAPAP